MGRFLFTAATVTALFCDLVKAKVNNATGNSDFAVIAKSRYFVDKTLLIKDFLNDDPSVSVITAPFGFGKSTVIDMIKRFAGLVAERGVQVAPNTTDNYRLFCSHPPLAICRDRAFVEEHLAQHPIIHLDFKPLAKARSSKALKAKMRSVHHATFLQHANLFEVKNAFPHLWKSGLHETWLEIQDTFLPYTERDIHFAVKTLASSLSRDFKKKVIILLDDYDSYRNSTFYKNSESRNKTIYFFDYLFTDLFKFNPYLDRALLMGESVKPTASNAIYYPFLGDHKCAGYTGFTQDEVDGLLKRIIKDVTKIKETRRTLQQRCGYPLKAHNTSFYSPSTVIKFLENIKNS